MTFISKLFRTIHSVLGAVSAAVVLGAGLPAIAQDGPSAALMARAQEQGHIRVIVGLNVPAVPEGTLSADQVAVQRSGIAAAQGALAGVMGADNVVRSFETIPYAALSLTPEQLATVAAMPGVTSIVEDVADAPSLDVSTRVIGARRVWQRGYIGTGWAVAVLDTGIYYRHRAFDTAILSGACYSSNDAGSGSTSLCQGGATSRLGRRAARTAAWDVDGAGHGTHVASIVAGDYPRRLRGVAHGAQLIPIQVFSLFPASYCGGAECVLSWRSDQMAGLERVLFLTGRHNIAAVNMSLGGGRYYGNCDDESPAYTLLVENLRAAGVATVISSGNKYYTDSIGFPACISSAITVGATNDADAIASFSNQADGLVELMAPGVGIEAAYIGGRRATGVLSGTSMAAPHVAGAFALMREVSPTSTVSEILHALQCTGVTVSRAGTPGTFQRINLNRARLELLRHRFAGC